MNTMMMIMIITMIPPPTPAAKIITISLVIAPLSPDSPESLSSVVVGGGVVGICAGWRESDRVYNYISQLSTDN